MNKDNSYYVKEEELAVSAKEYLYTDSIYSCVAVYAMTKNYSILAHIATEKQREFTHGKVAKVEELEEILINDENLKGKTIYVGMVTGVGIPDEFDERREMISEQLDEVVENLNQDKFDVERLEDVESEYVILDNKNHLIKTEHLEFDYQVIDFQSNKRTR